MRTDDLTPETVSRVHELNAAYLRCIERGMLAMAATGAGVPSLVLDDCIPPDCAVVLVGENVHRQMAALREQALELTSTDRAASVLARAMGNPPASA